MWTLLVTFYWFATPGVVPDLERAVVLDTFDTEAECQAVAATHSGWAVPRHLLDFFPGANVAGVGSYVRCIEDLTL